MFHRKTQADEKVLAHVHESPLIMILPLIILSIFAIFFGMFANSLFIDIKYLSIWSDFLYVDESIDSNFITQNVPFIMKKLPLIMILLGCLIIFFLYFSLKKIIPLIKRHLSFYIIFSNTSGTLISYMRE